MTTDTKYSQEHIEKTPSTRVSKDNSLYSNKRGFVRYEEPAYIESLKNNPTYHTFDAINKHIDKLRSKVEKADEYKKMQIETKNGTVSNLNMIIGQNNDPITKERAENLNPTQLKTHVKALKKQKRYRLLEPVLPPLNSPKPKISLTGLVDGKKNKELLAKRINDVPKNILVNTIASQQLNISYSRYKEQKKCLEETNFTKHLEKKKVDLLKTGQTDSNETLITTKLPKIGRKSAFSSQNTRSNGLLLHTSKDELENLIGHKRKVKYQVIKKPIRAGPKVSSSDRFNMEYLRYHKY